MIKLELTKLDAGFMIKALKVAEKEERKKACHAVNEMDANEAQEIAVAFNALRNAILHEVEKGEQHEKN